MKKIYFYSLLTAGMIAGGCSKEAPFPGVGTEGIGQFSKGALDLDVSLEETVKQKAPTRADGNALNIDDFKIVFTNAATNTPAASFDYGQMPDIVELNAGTYRVTARYGQDAVAAFENPVYTGESGEFTITPQKITSDIGTIKCNLANVKASIYFDPILKQRMDDEAYVEVKVGKSSTSALNFKKEHSDNATAGYFQLGAETTLVATFKGKIDGAETTETKTLNGIAVGNHYRITFKLHNHNGESTGNIGGAVTVDASVSVTDVNRKVEIIPDEPLDDNERPKEDPIPGGDDPVVPPVEEGPQIIAVGNVPLGVPTEVPEDVSTMECKLLVKTPTPTTTIIVDIESDTLTPEELGSAGLASHIDLVNDDNSILAPLNNFGFPIKDEVKGQKEIVIWIQPFLLSMLKAPGEGTHKFHITVHTEGNDPISDTLILVTK